MTKREPDLWQVQDHAVSMDTILNTLKAGFPHRRYDSEVEVPDTDIIPTVLSRNPNQYEKDIRNIVIDLYSDRHPNIQDKDPTDTIHMNENTGSLIASIIAAPPTEMSRKPHSDDVSSPSQIDKFYSREGILNPPILYRYKETALTEEVLRQYELSETAPSSATSKQDALSYRNGEAKQHYYSTLDNSRELPRSHFGGCYELQLHSSSFSDSGIQLERCPETDSNSSQYQSIPDGRDEGLDNVKNHAPSSAPFIRDITEKGYKSTQGYCSDGDGLSSRQDTQEDSALTLVMVNMEGKLESVTSEYNRVLEEKNELQKKLNMHEDKAGNKVDSGEKQIVKLRSELEKIRAKEISLESKIAELQHLNDQKDLKVSDAEENLKSSQLCVQNLQQKLLDLEGEVLTKSNGIEELENELFNLTSAFEEAKLHYEESDKEKSVLCSDVSTLMNAKSWLMKQLEKSKKVQVSLQIQLDNYDTTIQAQNQQVERLKSDNVRVSQVLTETQQKAITEKTMILEHLEKVESDLLNQDIAFRTLESEKTTVKRELEVKIESLEKENSLLQNLAKSAQRLEQELKALQIDAKSKETLLNHFKKEKDELNQHVLQSRDIIEGCQKNIQTLNDKLLENEEKIASMTEEKADQQTSIKDLKQKNAVLTDKVQEANREKDALDSAVQMLRLELDKVERRFKMMRRDLVLKTKQLEEVTRQKDGFVIELRMLREELEKHKEVMEELRDTILNRDDVIRELQTNKAKVLTETRVLSEHLKRTQLEFHEAHKEKEKLLTQLKNLNSDLSKVEKQFYNSCSEKAKLEGELESTKRVLDDYSTAKQAEHESLRYEIKELESTYQYEATRHRDEAVNLKRENEFMKGQLAQKLEQHKNIVASLEENLTKVEEVKEKEKEEVKNQYEGLLMEASEKLQIEKTEKKQVVTTLNQEKELLSIKCAELEERLRNTAAMNQNRVHSLENELHVAKTVIEEQKSELEKRLLLAVELEREKGRLAGLRTSQKALREHCSNIEKLSANRELKISKLQAKLQDIIIEKEKQNKEAQSKLNDSDKILKTQAEKIDELRRGLDSEKREIANLRSNLSTSEQETEDILKKLSKACVELENTNLKYEKSVLELYDHKRRQQELQMNLQRSEIAAQKQENESQLLKEREKIQNDLTRAIEWKLSHCTKELELAKEQLRLSDERHQSELETLKTAIHVANSEAAYLRREVSIARKSKCENQEKYFTSRDDLISARQETQVTKQNLFAACQQLRYLKSAILNSREVKELQEFVKNDDEMSFVTNFILAEPTDHDNSQFKSSVDSLRDCMLSIRNQILSLQKQMDNHTVSIYTAASSWRIFEKNVQNLQTECAAVRRKVLSAEKDVK